MAKECNKLVYGYEWLHAIYLAKAKINVCFLKLYLHTAMEANLGLLHSKKFQKMLILPFEANSSAAFLNYTFFIF